MLNFTSRIWSVHFKRLDKLLEWFLIFVIIFECHISLFFELIWWRCRLIFDFLLNDVWAYAWWGHRFVYWGIKSTFCVRTSVVQVNKYKFTPVSDITMFFFIGTICFGGALNIVLGKTFSLHVCNISLCSLNLTDKSFSWLIYYLQYPNIELGPLKENISLSFPPE